MAGRCWDMCRTLACIALLPIMACSLPSPRFAGAHVGTVALDGMRFAVYRRADEVEVHRSGGGIPRERDVLLGAIRAIEIATGCGVRPRSVYGDQGVVTAEIDCAA